MAEHRDQRPMNHRMDGRPHPCKTARDPQRLCEHVCTYMCRTRPATTTQEWRRRRHRKKGGPQYWARAKTLSETHPLARRIRQFKPASAQVQSVLGCGANGPLQVRSSSGQVDCMTPSLYIIVVLTACWDRDIHILSVPCSGQDPTLLKASCRER